MNELTGPLPAQDEVVTCGRATDEVTVGGHAERLTAGLIADQDVRKRLVARIKRIWQCLEWLEVIAILLASPIGLFVSPMAFFSSLAGLVALQVISFCFQAYLTRLERRIGMRLPNEGLLWGKGLRR